MERERGGGRQKYRDIVRQTNRDRERQTDRDRQKHTEILMQLLHPALILWPVLTYSQINTTQSESKRGGHWLTMTLYMCYWLVNIVFGIWSASLFHHKIVMLPSVIKLLITFKLKPRIVISCFNYSIYLITEDLNLTFEILFYLFLFFGISYAWEMLREDE